MTDKAGLSSAANALYRLSLSPSLSLSSPAAESTAAATQLNSIQLPLLLDFGAASSPAQSHRHRRLGRPRLGRNAPRGKRTFVESTVPPCSASPLSSLAAAAATAAVDCGGVITAAECSERITEWCTTRGQPSSPKGADQQCRVGRSAVPPHPLASSVMHGAFAPAMLHMPQLLIASPYPGPETVPFASTPPPSQPSVQLEQPPPRTQLAVQVDAERQQRWVDDRPNHLLSTPAAASLPSEASRPHSRSHRRQPRSASTSSQRRQWLQSVEREQRRVQRADDERQRRCRKHTPHPVPMTEEMEEEEARRAGSEPLPTDRWSLFVRSLRPSARAEPPRLWSPTKASDSVAEVEREWTAASDVDSPSSLSMPRAPPQPALETESSSALSTPPPFPRSRPSASLWSQAALLPFPAVTRRRPRRHHRTPASPPPPPPPPPHHQPTLSPAPHYHTSPPVMYQREEPSILWSPSPLLAPLPPPSTLWSSPSFVHTHRALLSPSQHASSAPSYARLLPLPSEVVWGAGGAGSRRMSPPPVFLPLRSGKTAIEWNSEDEGLRGVVEVGEMEEAGGWMMAEEPLARVELQQRRAAPRPPPRSAEPPPRPVREEAKEQLSEAQLLRVAKAVNQQAAGGAPPAAGAVIIAESAKMGREEQLQPARRSAGVQSTVKSATAQTEAVEAQVEKELRRMREKVALYISGRRAHAPPQTPPRHHPPPPPPAFRVSLSPPSAEASALARSAEAELVHRQLEQEAFDMTNRMAALVAAPPTPTREVAEVQVHEQLRPVPLPPEVGRKLELLKKGREKREGGGGGDGGVRAAKGEEELYEEAQGLIARFRREFDSATHAQARTEAL